MRFAVCFWALFPIAALGQAGSPVFEAASVKPAPPPPGAGRPAMHGGPGTPDPGRVTFNNFTLMNVLARAYDMKSYQVSGPAWLTSERYDIAAKIPTGATKDQYDLMLQNLLAARFHLALHRETRQLQGFHLIAGRSGPRLKASPETEPAASGQDSGEPESPPKTDARGFPILTSPGLVLMEGVSGDAVVTYLTAKGQTIAALVDFLSREFRLPILDRTGLGGKFDFTLEFAPQPPGAVPPVEAGPSNAAADSAPNLTVAVQQQLGLKLTPRKIAVHMLVIDHADRVPAGN